MRRAALEKSRTLRVWRKHLSDHLRGVSGPISPLEKIACACEFQVGRFRKGQRWRGCGRPRCMVCHYDKIMKNPTKAERIQASKFMQQLEEALADVHPKVRE